MGKDQAKRKMVERRITALQNHLKHVPEDARARIVLGADYAETGREADAMAELKLAVTLRANEASILYNVACVYALLKKKAEALDALRQAWEAGSKDAVWRAGAIRTSRCCMATRNLSACIRINPAHRRL